VVQRRGVGCQAAAKSDDRGNAQGDAAEVGEEEADEAKGGLSGASVYT
jgi:hypothetical protein